MCFICRIFLLILFVSLNLYSQNYLEVSTTIKGKGKNTSTLQQIWLNPEKIKIIQNTVQLIIRSDLQQVYFIDDPKKTYLVLDEKDLFLIDMLSLYIMPSLDFKIMNVQNLPDKKKINAWNCNKTRIMIKNNKEENISLINVWSTKDIKLNYSIMEQLIKIVKTPFSIIKEASDKIDGFPILLEGNVYFDEENYYIQSKVMKFSKESKNNEAIFEIPKGYKETRIDFLKTFNSHKKE